MSRVFSPLECAEGRLHSVHIVQGLHNALNASRDRFSGAEFDQLHAYLHDALADLSRHAYSGWEDKQDRKEAASEKAFEQRHKQAYQRKRQEAPNPATARPANPTAAAEVAKRDNTDGMGKAKPIEPTPGAHTKTSDGRSMAESQEDNGAFSDPVIDVRHSTGTMRFNEGHDLFKKFKGKAEKRMLKIFLRALHLAGVPPAMYERIIESLLSLK